MALSTTQEVLNLSATHEEATANLPVEALVYERMSQLRVNPLPAETWNRQIPQWDTKDDRDKEKRAAFEKELSALKEKVGGKYIQANKRALKAKSEALRKQREEIGASPRYHQQKAEILRSLEARPAVARGVQLQVDPRDVYTARISVLPFLAMFRRPFDYSVAISEYLKGFGDLAGAQQRISELSRRTHSQKLVFNMPTPEGQLRAKQLQRADMYNKQLQRSFQTMAEICCGAFYLPDRNFTKPYEELSPAIKELLTVKMMSNKLKCPLYALIGCGEAVNYLTFEMDAYDGYVKAIQKQFKEQRTWEPYKYYESARAYKELNKRCKGVAAQYSRCGYEMHLMFRVECVLLYFIATLAFKTGKEPELSGSEFVVFQAKIKDSLQNFDKFDKQTDLMWTAVKEFVQKRTGGVKAVKITLDEEGNPIEDPNAPKKRRVYDRFEFNGFGISYSQGRVFQVSQEPPEQELYEDVQTVKKITFDDRNRIVNNACTPSHAAPTQQPNDQQIQEKPQPPQEQQPPIAAQEEQITEAPPLEMPSPPKNSPPPPPVEVPPPDDMWRDDEPPADVPDAPPVEVPPPDDMWRSDAQSNVGAADSMNPDTDTSMTSEGRKRKKRKHSADAEAALQAVMSMAQSSMDASTLPTEGDEAPRKRKKRSKKLDLEPESTTQDTQE